MRSFEEQDRLTTLGLRRPRDDDWHHGYPEYRVVRDDDRCIRCLVCVRQCPYDSTFYDVHRQLVYNRDENCVNCRRCEFMCPTNAIEMVPWGQFRDHDSWKKNTVRAIYKQADTGAVNLTGLGNDAEYVSYFDRMVIDASQVTNPSIDPLREPMELRTFIGRKPERWDESDPCPNIECQIPLIFAPMSFGAISLNFQKGLARAAREMGTFFNTGEGGLHPDLRDFGTNAIVQVASGRFGVDRNYLNNAVAVEIKIGQGAKPGIGGHLPGEV